jgi:hypothetical protein
MKKVLFMAIGVLAAVSCRSQSVAPQSDLQENGWADDTSGVNPNVPEQLNVRLDCSISVKGGKLQFAYDPQIEGKSNARMTGPTINGEVPFKCWEDSPSRGTNDHIVGACREIVPRGQKRIHVAEIWFGYSYSKKDGVYTVNLSRTIDDPNLVKPYILACEPTYID